MFVGYVIVALCPGESPPLAFRLVPSANVHWALMESMMKHSLIGLGLVTTNGLWAVNEPRGVRPSPPLPPLPVYPPGPLRSTEVRMPRSPLPSWITSPSLIVGLVTVSVLPLSVAWTAQGTRLSGLEESATPFVTCPIPVSASAAEQANPNVTAVAPSSRTALEPRSDLILFPCSS